MHLEPAAGFADLKMAAIARHLGVTPSALNYYVRDKEDLLEMVASAIVDFAMDESWLPAADADWRVWVRAYARELRRMLLAQPQMALYFRYRLDTARQLDSFFGALARAGFDSLGVARASTFVAQVVFMNVRDELMARPEDGHPQERELRQALVDAPETALPHLRAYLATGGHAQPEEQFLFDLDCVIDGLQAHLRRSDVTPGPPAG